MNRRIIVVLASVGAIMAAGIAVAYAATLGSQRRDKGAARQVEAGPVPPAWRLAEDPANVYSVEPMPVRGKVKARTEQEDRLLEQATAIVSRLRPVPEDRLRFFDWMNRPDAPVTFGGWGVFVQQATPTPDGWLITLQVTPYASGHGGGPAIVNNCFIEEYLWANDKLTYLRGASHPEIGAEPWISSM